MSSLFVLFSFPFHQYHARFYFLFSLVLIAQFLSACESRPRHYVISGSTMGTEYHITVAASQPPSESLGIEISQRLESINQQMSTYRNDSEISRFNQAEKIDEFTVSTDFATVMQRAIELSVLTKGAFNPALKPLIDRWGFGARPALQELPPPHIIEKLLRHSDFQQVELQDNRLRKLDAELELDLSAIAKGYAVDVLSDTLRQAGFDHHLVEIGGEVRAHGQRFDGQSWKVAIQQPDDPSASVNQVIALQQQAIATSGDYRNFVEIDGKRYAHIIDPKTGYPPDNGIASVSVITTNCMQADVLATALMVMDLQQGLAFAEQQNLAVFYILRNPTGFDTRASAAFQRLAASTP